MKLSGESIDKQLSKIINNKNVFSAILHVENEDRSFVHTTAAGDIKPNSQYFIASVTKLYVTAVLLRLIEENNISLNDKIGKYLSDEIMQNLHVYRNPNSNLAARRPILTPIISSLGVSSRIFVGNP